jgi:signal peptidase I
MERPEHEPERGLPEGRPDLEPHLPPDLLPANDGRRGTRRATAVRFLVEVGRSVVLALVVLTLVRSLLVEAFKIPTSSMEGTLLAGDFLLVNKVVFGAEIPGVGRTLPALSEPEHSEVIVFHPPHEPDKHYVKRVVGVPGDTLYMSAKVLYRNGVRQTEPFARYSDGNGDAVHPGMMWQSRYLVSTVRVNRYRPSRDNWGPIVVPEGSFFVLGDNRDNSEDSRYWGFVDREAIRGRPWIVYYSSGVGPQGEIQVFREVRWDRIGGRIQ